MPSLVLFLVVLLSFALGPSKARYHHLNPKHHSLSREDVFIQVPADVDDNITGNENSLVVDEKTGIVYNPYSKFHPGRHVCANHKNVTVPVKVKQSFCKPTYKKYMQRCHDNQLCSGIRVVYETAYREVLTTKQTKQTLYVCCPGWSQESNRTFGCNQPICINPCQNGGICTKPDFCTCKEGFSGKTCELDVDECLAEKPCDQTCINIPGSYRCECRENYSLQDDGMSCKRNDDDIGIEAKEFQLEALDERIHKIEIILEENKNLTADTNLIQVENKIEILNKNVKGMQKELNDLEEYKKDLENIKAKVFRWEHNEHSQYGKLKRKFKH